MSYTKVLSTIGGKNTARVGRIRVSIDQRLSKKRRELQALDPWALVALDIKLANIPTSRP